MKETLFEEMKRYVRFGAADQRELRALQPLLEPRLRSIAEDFYARLSEHEQARAVFSGPDQIERLKGTLVVWMRECLTGPWDEAYYERRARIGRVHVRIGLAQRFMFGAMDQIRLALAEAAADRPARDAIDKILDLELAIMLETYAETFVGKVQELERRERELLERRLAIREAWYQEVVENGPALVTTTRADGRVLMCNRPCEKVTGLRRDEVAGRPWLEVFVPADQRAAVARLWQQVVATGQPQIHEGLVTPPKGPTHRVRWHLTALPGEDEVTLCALGLDVTEERNLAVRARRSERLASLGTMAAGLAHELRNPLNSAQLQLTLAKRRLGRLNGEAAGALEATDAVAVELTRLTSLVEEFLMFSRPQPLVPTRLDLRDTCAALVRFLGPDAERQGITLTLDAADPVYAQADEDRMKQVLLNLVRNAVEAIAATEKPGCVTVAVRVDGDEAVASVEDDGPGLPGADAPIFEPFYTTKTQGTGLGLAIVHRIVTDHDGRIDVESRPGLTRFTVRIPVSS